MSIYKCQAFQADDFTAFKFVNLAPYINISAQHFETKVINEELGCNNF